MPENRLLSESDLWFSPSQMKDGAKNALLYPFRNPDKAAEFGLSVAPGSGEAMSARDAWDASGRAGNALLQGNYGEAASEYGNMATAALGAIPGAGIIARGTKRGAAWMDRNMPTAVNKLLDTMAPKASQDTLYAIPAWHGSPHDFDAFKLDKIGTGEGAQAYGHGLYFAENPSVARSYTALAKDRVPDYQSVIQREFPDLAGISDDMPKQLYMKSIHTTGTPKEAAALVQSNTPALAQIPRDRLASAIERLRNAREGRLYRTELDVEPEDLLDWDKPLSQQSEKVKAAIRKLGESNPNQFRKNEINNHWFNSDGDFFSGSRLYDVLQGDFGGREGLTQAFREAGIPGIKYLDQGSRGAGQGSSNFVIFDDALVKILGKE